jgi:hypothetical protein
MTSPVALWDYKRDEAMVVGLTAFLPNPAPCYRDKLMAQLPIAQPSLANELSTADNV